MGDPLELRLRGDELTLRKADAARISVGDVRPGSSDPCRHRGAAPQRPVRNRPAQPPRRAAERPPRTRGVLLAPQGGPARNPRRQAGDVRPGGQPDLRQDDPVQPAHWLQPARGQLPGGDGRPQGRQGPQPSRGHGDRPAGHLASLSPYTSEEVVTREFLLTERPSAIINIVDATNIERNLYLTMQLLELDIPMVIALNMMDELRANGGSVDVNAPRRRARRSRGSHRRRQERGHSTSRWSTP